MRYGGQKLKWKHHQKFPLSVLTLAVLSSPNEVAGGWGSSQPSTSVLFSHFLLFLNFIYVFSLLFERQRDGEGASICWFNPPNYLQQSGLGQATTKRQELKLSLPCGRKRQKYLGHGLLP